MSGPLQPAPDDHRPNQSYDLLHRSSSTLPNDHLLHNFSAMYRDFVDEGITPEPQSSNWIKLLYTSLIIDKGTTFSSKVVAETNMNVKNCMVPDGPAELRVTVWWKTWEEIDQRVKGAAVEEKQIKKTEREAAAKKSQSDGTSLPTSPSGFSNIASGSYQPVLLPTPPTPSISIPSEIVDDGSSIMSTTATGTGTDRTTSNSGPQEPDASISAIHKKWHRSAGINEVKKREKESKRKAYGVGEDHAKAVKKARGKGKKKMEAEEEVNEGDDLLDPSQIRPPDNLCPIGLAQLLSYHLGYGEMCGTDMGQWWYGPSFSRTLRLTTGEGEGKVPTERSASTPGTRDHSQPQPSSSTPSHAMPKSSDPTIIAIEVKDRQLVHDWRQRKGYNLSALVAGTGDRMPAVGQNDDVSSDEANQSLLNKQHRLPRSQRRMKSPSLTLIPTAYQPSSTRGPDFDPDLTPRSSHFYPLLSSSIPVSQMLNHPNLPSLLAWDLCGGVANDKLVIDSDAREAFWSWGISCLELLFGPEADPFTWQRSVMGFGEDAKKARLQLIAEFNARLTRVKEAGREGERDELSAKKSGYGDCRVEMNDPIRPFQIARWGKGGGTLDRYQRRHAGSQDTSTMAIPMGGRQEQLQVPELGRDVSITPMQTGHSSHPHPPSQPHSQMRPPPPTPTWAAVVAGRPASILPPHSNPQSRLNVTPTPLAGPGPPGQVGSSKKQKTTSITSPLTLTMARYETKHPKPMMPLNGPETGNVSTANMLQRELKRRHDKVLGWDGRTLSYPHPRSDQSPPRDSYTDANADSVSDSESVGCEAGDTDTELEPEPWSLSDHVDFLTEMKVYILPVTREEMSGMIQTRVGVEMELWKGRVRVGTV